MKQIPWLMLAALLLGSCAHNVGPVAAAEDAGAGGAEAAAGTEFVPGPVAVGVRRGRGVATAKLVRSQGSTEFDEVRCGLQDRAGNMWFGTTGEGVYWFDGKGFVQYTMADGLASNTLWCILEEPRGAGDAEGNGAAGGAGDSVIWFGTDAGLCRWDGTKIERVVLGPAVVVPVPLGGAGAAAVGGGGSAVVAKQAAVWSLLLDSKGTLWVGTAEGMYRRGGAGVAAAGAEGGTKDGAASSASAIRPFLADAAVQNPGGLALKMVDDILEDRDGTIWFASGMPPGMEGLCRFDGTTLMSFKPGGQEWIRTVKQDPEGVLWMGTRHKGVWLYDGTNFVQYTGRAGLGWPMLVDRLGNIWFGGEENADGLTSKTGPSRFDGQGFRTFGAAEGLRPFGVWCMIEDRAGHIWVGTRNVGLYRFDGAVFERMSE